MQGDKKKKRKVKQVPVLIIDQGELAEVLYTGMQGTADARITFFPGIPTERGAFNKWLDNWHKVNNPE